MVEIVLKMRGNGMRDVGMLELRLRKFDTPWSSPTF